MFINTFFFLVALLFFFGLVITVLPSATLARLEQSIRRHSERKVPDTAERAEAEHRQ
jgi:hypothetical protein